MEEKNTEKKLTVRAVERSLDILSCFIEKRELGLTEIASEVNLNKSTVYRLLNTLEYKGFLIRNTDTDKYRLGYKVWELSSQLTGMDDPATLLLPEMKRLRDTVGETISLYVRDGLERIRIQSVESNLSIRRVAPVGARLPLSVGASSKVLLAYEEPQNRESILNELIKYYNIKKQEFYKAILQTQQQGYATSFEEREAGAVALSVPVFDRSGVIIAALSISGPVNRLTKEKFEEIAPIARESSIRMGKLLR